ncbi:cell division protein SepF [Tissierella creatinophila]|uniref:Cell division protein SepF n=1 Tax=Tissierella creatinophila DSM 6911 TaxID=1123403 RepID=A0A1U7M2Z3_TISCR|nr:cell division protein SepF [Tissierella creatinophila]OLS01692.1 cell division protein SepF [Tissierella creatinophila DSM 6911]
MGNMMNKFKYFIGLDDYDEEEEDFHGEEDFEIPVSTKTKKINNKVVNIHTNSNMKIVVHEPINYEEAPEIVENLKSRKVVVINFEQLDTNLKRQIFDFVNGALYAMEGKIQKVTKDIFILAPNNVEIDGLKEELKSKGIFPW